MIKQPENVRVANIRDCDQIYKILVEGLYEENGAFSLSEPKVKQMIISAVTGNGGIIGVIEENGTIAATIGMTLGNFWYSDDYHIEEYWNYVRPEYRKHGFAEHKRTNYAKDLIDFAKYCAEKMGLVLNIGIISTTRTEAKCRLYRRTLTPSGQFFLHNLEVASGPAISKISLGE